MRVHDSVTRSYTLRGAVLMVHVRVCLIEWGNGRMRVGDGDDNARRMRGDYEVKRKKG